jgi:uncharacterized protein YerC
MQPATDEQTATPGEATHLLDYTNLANLGTDALTAFLARIGRNRNAVSEIGGRIAAVLLTRDGKTQRGLADDTGIPKSTIDRWVAPYRTDAA